MWILVSYNRCLYQDGDWREGHFAELENGQFIVYAVSRNPSGRIRKIRSHSVDELEIAIQYLDEAGQVRSVVLLVGSARSRDLWVKHLEKAQNAPDGISGSTETAVFENVAIKSPTKDESRLAESPSPGQIVRKRESLTGQWDALTSYMGAWHRRLFRFFEDGTVAYYEASPVACVSLVSASSIICVEAGPRELMNGTEMAPLTLWSCLDDISLPKPPPEPVPQLNQITRRLSRAVGSFTAPKGDEPLPASQGWGSPVSCVTVGHTSHKTRDQWVKEIQAYTAWFSTVSLTDTVEGRRAKILHKGWGWKRGAFPFSGWKQRFFVLLSSRELLYYETDAAREPLGVIDLRKKKTIKPGKTNDKPQGFEEMIEIETQPRTWYFSPKALNRGEHAYEIALWMKHLNESEENFQKFHAAIVRKSSFAEYSANAFFVSTSSSTPYDKISVVELSSWQRMTGNVPPAILSESSHKEKLSSVTLGAHESGTGDEEWHDTTES